MFFSTSHTRSFCTNLKIKGSTLILLLTIVFSCAGIGGFTKSQAQASTNGKRQGVYLGGQKGWNIFKSRKKYKHIKNKRRRKFLSKKNNFNRKRSSYQRRKRAKFNKRNSAYKRNGRVKVKNSKLGKTGSLYSYNKKKAKKRKGRFPKSKSQLTPKLSIYASTGLIFTGRDENFDVNGELVNLYSNHRVSLHFTVGFHYNHTNKIAFGADIRGFRIRSIEEVESSANLQVNTLTINPYFKYNFISTSSNISPYALLGPSFTFTQIIREESGRVVQGDDPLNEEDVTVERVVFKESEVGTDWAPLIGVRAGLGVDFKIAKRMSGFVQADMGFSSSRNSEKILEIFNNNEADYLFYGFSFGLKYNLFQNSSLY